MQCDGLEVGLHVRLWPLGTVHIYVQPCVPGADCCSPPWGRRRRAPPAHHVPSLQPTRATQQAAPSRANRPAVRPRRGADSNKKQFVSTMDAVEAALGEAPGPYFLADFSLVRPAAAGTLKCRCLCAHALLLQPANSPPAAAAGALTPCWWRRCMH